MTFAAAFVHKKLETVRDYTTELAGFLEETTNQELLNDSRKRLITERLVQLIVDGMIDINQYFIRELKLALPDDLRGTFILLGQNGVLPKSFAEKISPVTGVRNLRRHFSDFKLYQQHIINYLEKHA